MAFKIRSLTNFNSITKLFKELANEFHSGQGALTATAGGAQAGTALSKTINRFTVVATAADSAQLPAAVVGLVRIVKNADTTDSMNVFPATGETINALSANAAYAVAATKCVMFVCGTAGKWDTILTA
jgi:hypothetical protein